MTSKYDPLQAHLEAQPDTQVSMSFTTIERLIGCRLPPSARKHRPWWSNNPRNSVITKAWLSAGYRTAQVDLRGERLVFCRQSKPGLTRQRQPFYGCMKGMLTIADDVDVTAPANPDWQSKDC